MSFGWGIVSTGKHPNIKIAPAMAAAGGGELVGVTAAISTARRRSRRSTAPAPRIVTWAISSRTRVSTASSYPRRRLTRRARRPGRGSRKARPVREADGHDDCRRRGECWRRAAARASPSAWLSTCASTRPIDARASSSPPGRWGASCSPKRSGRSACAAAMARRRARSSRSGGTPRSSSGAPPR